MSCCYYKQETGFCPQNPYVLSKNHLRLSQITADTIEGGEHDAGGRRDARLLAFVRHYYGGARSGTELEPVSLLYAGGL